MDKAGIHITICYSPAPRQLLEKNLTLRAPCGVAEAIAQSGVQAAWNLDADVRYGVWNKLAKDPANVLLADGDRLEIYRPLRVDPMTARRERFKSQGARSAGLFAQRRPGAKPGY